MAEQNDAVDPPARQPDGTADEPGSKAGPQSSPAEAATASAPAPASGAARASVSVPGTRRMSATEVAAIRSATGEARLYRAGSGNPEPPEPAQPPEPVQPPKPVQPPEPALPPEPFVPDPAPAPVPPVPGPPPTPPAPGPQPPGPVPPPPAPPGPPPPVPPPPGPTPVPPFPPPPMTSGDVSGPPPLAGRAIIPTPGPVPAPRTEATLSTAPTASVPAPSASSARTQIFPASRANGDQQRPGTGHRGRYEGDLSGLYGAGSGLSTVAFPADPVETSGSLTGHILAQGWTETPAEERSSNTRVVVALAVSLGLLVMIGVVVALIANNALDGLFGNLSGG
ncbi:hypothetical protein Sar04_37090 [Salinispora arenicola]|uniref:Uncharacterized protein n=2 Tax=Salinispora arenicola TaxID=168697 RepID=A0A542XMA3_SALAC|nr:hypothetical protein FB564_1915 [Salinispora arenicola]GIM86973.1 hypothetical protein Sar04_37090 [Salinispora arenicola]